MPLGMGYRRIWEQLANPNQGKNCEQRGVGSSHATSEIVNIFRARSIGFSLDARIMRLMSDLKGCSTAALYIEALARSYLFSSLKACKPVSGMGTWKFESATARWSYGKRIFGNHKTTATASLRTIDRTGEDSP